MAGDKKADIWMPLYIGDYLADTAHLDAERSGCYLHWLMHYWRKGPLPNDLRALISIGRLCSEHAPSIAQALLDEFFTKGDDDLHHQSRMDRELANWNAKKLKARDKAANAAASRWGKDGNEDAPSNAPSNAPSTPQAMLEQCPLPSPLPSPLKTTTEASASPSKNSSSIEDKALTPAMVASRVMAKLCLSTKELAVTLEGLCGAEMAEGRDAAELRDALIASWRDYEANKPSMTQYTKGPAKFFGEGAWRDKENWPWKEGKKPMRRVYING